MTDEKQHILEIYDVEEDPVPSAVKVEGVGVVFGPEGSKYYILRTEEPLPIGGMAITQLAVRPHYEGDPVERASESVCTVGIAYAPGGSGYAPGEQYGFNDFVFWRVGKICPCPPPEH